MDQEQGNLMINDGDVISFHYNSTTGKFTATGPNNQYVYYTTLMKDKEYVLFLGISSRSTSKVTVTGL